MTYELRLKKTDTHRLFHTIRIAQLNGSTTMDKIHAYFFLRIKKWRKKWLSGKFRGVSSEY